MDPRLRFLLELGETCGGSIPFERFMEAALYHPEFGYYTKHAAEIGPRGDFSTSATLGQNLGLAIHAWLLQHPAPAWIEIGPGNGALTESILRADGFLQRRRRNVILVERSPALRELQEKRLRHFRVRWTETVPEALELCGGEANIYSNELVDAFPCRVFEKTMSSWRELHLRIENGRVVEALQDAAPPPSSCFDEALAFKDGQRVEIHPSHRRWLRQWSDAWKSGHMLTVDYGGSAAMIYHRRPGGTLRAYWKHQRFEGRDVFARFGQQDLTADVNTDDLVRSGEALGWRSTRLQSQAEFLANHAPRPKTSAENFLTGPEGAGRAFFVLEQARGANPD